jgi:hypothetical protein
VIEVGGKYPNNSAKICFKPREGRERQGRGLGLRWRTARCRVHRLRRRYLALAHQCGVLSSLVWTQSRPTRPLALQADTKPRCLRPLAYPCLLSTPTTGLDACRASFSQRTPMYQCTSVQGTPTTPLVVPSPKHPAPCHPSLAVPSLVPCQPSCTRPCNVSTEPRWTGSSTGGPRDRPSTRSRPVTCGSGVYRTSPPQNTSVGRHCFASCQTSPTTESCSSSPTLGILDKTHTHRLQLLLTFATAQKVFVSEYTV